MFILSLPSPISCKGLSEGHALRCASLYKAVCSAAPGHRSAAREVRDGRSGWLCLSPRTALSPSGANRGKSKSPLSCLKVSTRAGADRCTTATNALCASLRTHLPRHPATAGCAGLPSPWIFIFSLT